MSARVQLCSGTVCRICDKALVDEDEPDVSGHAKTSHRKGTSRSPSQTTAYYTSPEAPSDKPPRPVRQPVCYYYECDHWTHLRCAGSTGLPASTAVCAACVVEEMLQPDRGVHEVAYGVIARKHTLVPPNPAGVHGQWTPVNVGDAHCVNANSIKALSTALGLGADPAVELPPTPAMREDDERLAKAVALLEGAFALPAEKEGDVDSAHTAMNRLKGLESHLFSLREFKQSGGSIAALVAMGATWDQLCTWGLGDTYVASDAAAARAPMMQTLCWPGADEVEMLCRAPVSMTFVTFFERVCASNFDTLRQLRVKTRDLRHMGFSFRRCISMLLGSPAQAVRAFRHISGPECVNELHLVNDVIRQLREACSSQRVLMELETTLLEMGVVRSAGLSSRQRMEGARSVAW